MQFFGHSQSQSTDSSRKQLKSTLCLIVPIRDYCTALRQISYKLAFHGADTDTDISDAPIV